MNFPKQKPSQFPESSWTSIQVIIQEKRIKTGTAVSSNILIVKRLESTRTNKIVGGKPLVKLFFLAALNIIYHNLKSCT